MVLMQSTRIPGLADDEAHRDITLSSVDGSYEITGTLFCSSTDVCCIMHEAMADITLDGLPRHWNGACGHNAIKLSCGHVFHVSSLMVHYLTNDMRCPVCRQGSTCQLDVRCLPHSFQTWYQHQPPRVPDTFETYSEEQVHEMMQLFIQDLFVLVEIHSSTNVVVAHSRLLPVTPDAPDAPDAPAAVPPDMPAQSAASATQFNVQRALVRLLGRHAASPCASPTDRLIVRVCHPLLEDSIASGWFSLTQFRTMCQKERVTRTQMGRAALQLHGVPCGHVQGTTDRTQDAFLVHLQLNLVQGLILSSLLGSIVALAPVQ